MLTVCAAAAPVRAGDGASLVGPASADEIASLVRSLGDPSYEVRTFATRRLCAVGPEAADALRTAAETGDAEVAMRARQLLAIFDRLLFAGAKVTLAFSTSQIAWNEPVDLILTVANESRHEVRVPFAVGPQAAQNEITDADQVGAMLDVADWLHVRGPDGRTVELRMDDIDIDDAVAEAVRVRVQGAPPTAVPPGKSVTLTVRGFNRGFARYPLLDQGDFAVSFEYVPEWTDEVLTKAQAGRVTANVATMHVAAGAPATVDRRAGRPELLIERVADGFAGRLLNRMDQPILLNTNFGVVPPFAQAQWVMERDGERREIAVAEKPASSWKDFEASKVVEVQAGEAVELARFDDGRIRKALGDAAARPGWTVALSYSNICDRSWHVRQGSALIGNPDAPPFLRAPVSRRLLGTRTTSNRLSIMPE